MKQPLPSVSHLSCFDRLTETYIKVDYETDAIIQASLRTELKNDVTVITVAHRLQTIMDYNKIVSPIQYLATPECDAR